MSKPANNPPAPPAPPFFVTGLPRSRTAWLANFLTAQGALCVHEGLLYGQEPLIAWLQASTRRGLSDSMLSIHWQAIFAHFQDYRLVIIERDPEQCWESLTLFLDREELRVPRRALQLQFAEAQRCLQQMAQRCTHLAVKFDDLGDLPTLRDLWEHCLPGLPFDEERARLLARLNVQQHVASVRAGGVSP